MGSGSCGLVCLQELMTIDERSWSDLVFLKQRIFGKMTLLGATNNSDPTLERSFRGHKVFANI